MNTLTAKSRAIPLTFPSYLSKTFPSSVNGLRCRAMLGEVQAQALLVQVYTWCSSNLPLLDDARKHLSRDLCHADRWNTLSRRERICAGLCIAFLVNREAALPLRMHKTRSGKGSKSYWIVQKHKVTTTRVDAHLRPFEVEPVGHRLTP